MYAYQFIYTTKLNQLTVSDFFLYGVPNLVFILNVIICHFSGGDMVMWTTSHCFDFFCMQSYVYCLNMYKIIDHTRTNEHSIRPAAKTLF